MRYVGGAVGHKGLPSNRITIRCLLDKVKRFIHRCRQTQSIRYPEDDLNDVLLDEIWANVSMSHSSKTGEAETTRCTANIKDLESQHDDKVDDEQDIPSDEEDYGYRWDYPNGSEPGSDIEDEHQAEEDHDDADLGPEDDWMLDEESNEDGYADL